MKPALGYFTGGHRTAAIARSREPEHGWGRGAKQTDDGRGRDERAAVPGAGEGTVALVGSGEDEGEGEE
jgi:hypothetical protein